MKESTPYMKGKSTALTVICVILTFVLCTLLLGCFALHRFVYDEPVRKAFAKIDLTEVTLSDGTPLVMKINRDYIGEGILAEDKLVKILQGGTFDNWVGEKAEAYVQFIAGDDHSGAEFPDIMTPEIETLINDNDSTIRLYTGLHEFAAENPQIMVNMKPDLERWNKHMRATYTTGFKANLLFAAVSRWIWYVLGALLLALLIWMIVICVKSQERVGTALKRISVTCFIPGTLMLLWGLLGGLILRIAGYGYLSATVNALHSAPLLTGGLCCLASTALFIFGILWNTAAAALQNLPRRERKPAPVRTAPQPIPASAPAVALTKPAEPVTESPAPVTGGSRKFCRFCGGELINSDAKFCYKCGKAQE